MEWTPSYPSCTKGFYKLGYNCSAPTWAGYAYHLWTVLTWRAAQYRSCSPTIEPRGFSLLLWRGQQNVIMCFEMDIIDTHSEFKFNCMYLGFSRLAAPGVWVWVSWGEVVPLGLTWWWWTWWWQWRWWWRWWCWWYWRLWWQCLGCRWFCWWCLTSRRCGRPSFSMWSFSRAMFWMDNGNLISKKQRQWIYMLKIAMPMFAWREPSNRIIFARTREGGQTKLFLQIPFGGSPK